MFPLLIAGLAFGQAAHEFSHFQHVKVEELECSDCHSKTMKSGSMEDIKKVEPKTCMKCHDGEAGFESPRPVLLIDPSFRLRKPAEKGTLKFSHQAHAGAKVDCNQCHGPLLDKGAAPTPVSARQPDPMSMQSCMECHVQKADVSCLTCHDKVTKPLNHLSAAWIRGHLHGMEATLREKDCAMCHETGQPQVGACSDCHMGTDARKVHGLNYRFNHGTDVKFKKMDCAVCHQPLDQFCADCHEGAGRPAR